MPYENQELAVKKLPIIFVAGDGDFVVHNIQPTCTSELVGGGGDQFIIITIKGWVWGQLSAPEAIFSKKVG